MFNRAVLIVIASGTLCCLSVTQVFALRVTDEGDEAVDVAAPVASQEALIEVVMDDSAANSASASVAAPEELVFEVVEEETKNRAPRNDIPSVGFVPKEKRVKARFDMVAAPTSKASDIYKKMVEAEAKRNYEQALRLARQTLQLDARHPHALLAEGRLLVKTGQYGSARSVLAEITTARTDDWRPWFWLGTSELMLDQLNAAESAIEEALARNADIVEVWLHRALIEQQRNNWRVAIQLLSIANELAPGHPLVMLNAAMCREALGYTDEAASAYRKFLTQSHRGDVSRLLRFEVINHLSGADFAATDPRIAKEVEKTVEYETSQDQTMPIAAGNE